MTSRFGFILLLLPTVSLRAADSPSAVDLEFFEKKIRPLLIDRCHSCHSTTAKKVKGGLLLDRPEDWLKGGVSGPALVPGMPEKSLLIQAVRRDSKEVEAMPPEKELTREQIADLSEWVKRGAPAPKPAVASASKKESVREAKQRWPFLPVSAKVAVPSVQNPTWPKSDLDRFILAKLEAKGITPLGETDKRTLIRRVTYDLIGLPPRPEEVEAFVEDTRSDAFAKVVDRLLASPQYGERWGRHWLDVVRYADTAGDNSDYPIPQMYLYRNWVIDAINRDLPFDQFVQQQLAGDLLPARDEAERRQQIIATGYIASARRFGSRVDDYPQHLTIEDTLDNLGRAFLGLTINCARCHDHKFDPVSMNDYYALYGIFHSTQYPWPGIELEKRQRDLVPLTSREEVKRINRDRSERLNQFTAEIKQLEAEKKAATEKPRHDELQKRIDGKKKERDQFHQMPLPYPTAYSVGEGKKIEDSAIQIKGDPEKPGSVAKRGFLEVLGGQQLASNQRTSGRKELAEWISSPQNPLFARVFVNRVWYHHFGRGLVSTPNDFGKQGTPPTHPELLDYLARSFIDSGFSVKQLHRQILLSSTYQMASLGEAPKGVETLDPNNELLWKFRRQRLDAESIRDAMLSVSGQLDPAPGNAHPFPDQRVWDFTQHKPFRAVYETNKRSVYLMTQRIQRHPYLGIFDGPDTGASTGSRITSTTTLQSLYFLNDEFVHEIAKGLNQRLQKQSESERIDAAYRILFARPPSETERTQGEKYLDRAVSLLEGNRSEAWQSYLRTLLRLNEMIYLN